MRFLLALCLLLPSIADAAHVFKMVDGRPILFETEIELRVPDRETGTKEIGDILSTYEEMKVKSVEPYRFQTVQNDLGINKRDQGLKVVFEVPSEVVTRAQGITNDNYYEPLHAQIQLAGLHVKNWSVVAAYNPLSWAVLQKRFSGKALTDEEERMLFSGNVVDPWRPGRLNYEWDMEYTKEKVSELVVLLWWDYVGYFEPDVMRKEILEENALRGWVILRTKKVTR